MKLETKYSVLVGLYLEYVKDVPDLRSCNPDTLNIKPEAFYAALDKLQSEGLIKNVDLEYKAEFLPEKPLWANAADWSNMRFTNEGVKFMQNHFDVFEIASNDDIIRQMYEKAIKNENI